MPLIFGEIPYAGSATDRVVLPCHQYPPTYRHSDQPQQQQQHHRRTRRGGRGAGSTPAIPTSILSEDVGPFFLRSYHSLNLDPSSRHILRLHKIRKAIQTLQFLGYEIQLGTPLVVDGKQIPSLTLFRHNTDPNKRMMALIATAHQVLNRLNECFDEPSGGSEEVRAWKREVYDGGWEVLDALEGLVRRFRYGESEAVGGLNLS